MADPLQLEVLTPSGRALAVQAAEVTARGPMGEFGVLPGHTFLVSRLDACVLRYQSGGRTQELEIGPGFCRVGEDRVVILADAAGPGASRVPEPSADPS